MHGLLVRQIHRYLETDEPDFPPQFRRLLAAVDDAYLAADTDRRLLENALELSSEELMTRNRQLLAANAELQQFAYVASHDLKEPLRMVTGFTQLLKQRYGDKLDADALEFINFAVDGANRMTQLIDALLAYARVSAQAKSFTAVDPGQVLERTRRDLGPLLSEAGAVLEIGALPVVKSDPLKLGQLFQNLVSNAVKFRGAAAPRIVISAAAAPEWCTFCVADNGIGIPADARERIFLMFQRLHEAGRYPGVGIGLAICKKIVEWHGGSIWTESVEGEGSRFFFTLKPWEGPNG
jgi:light-regulated signal transduction histidine kinase (bacteriophytochrome)